VEYFLEHNLENIENTHQAAEIADKLNAVIERLINKEGILIVTTDNDDKTERVLSLNVNYESPIF
jgi:hypothetical protein